MAVRLGGAVAWITDASKQAARYEVHALDRHGSRALAVGSGIDATSLALAGSALYWTENAVPFAAKLE
jgi:hypothetical protein